MTNVSAEQLKQFARLRKFPLVKLKQLAEASLLRNFEKKVTIFDQEQAAQGVALLLSGVVQLSYVNRKRETIVAFVPPGELFGIDALSLKACHAFRAVALEKCSVAVVKARAFVESLLGVPYETFLLWHEAASALPLAIQLHCVHTIGIDLRQRLAIALTNLAREFGEPHAKGLRIDLRISHEALASLVGASRQQVTQHLNDFDRQGLIFREGRRIIIDPKKLRELQESGE